MKSLFNRFVREEEGQDLIEYALVAAIITIGSIALIKTIGSGVSTLYTNVNSNVASAS